METNDSLGTKHSILPLIEPERDGNFYPFIALLHSYYLPLRFD